jgi:hypothetical protein
MNDQEKLQLQRMIKENDVENLTPKIRELKHSQLIKEDVEQMLRIKIMYKQANTTTGSDNKTSSDNKTNDLNDKLISKCHFLFTYYTDIFNKIKNDEIDLSILGKFLHVLERIENNEIDQHEGSYIIGSLLKSMYVDSALRKSEKNEHNTEPEEKIKPKNINWKEFKNMNGK